MKEVASIKIEKNGTNPAWKNYVEEVAVCVPTVSLSNLEWADAIIFSVPTRFGNMPSQMKQFLDTTGGPWFNGKLVNKVVGAMASAQNPHGGKRQPFYHFIHLCITRVQLPLLLVILIQLHLVQVVIHMEQVLQLSR